MKSKFKKGDVVRYIGSNIPELANQIGTVFRVWNLDIPSAGSDTCPYQVGFYGEYGFYWYMEDSLELVVAELPKLYIELEI